MFLVKSNFFRSFQPMLVRTAKTSATDATKKSKPSDSDDESFLDEAAVGNDNQGEQAPSTGRERSLNRVQLIGRVGADPKVGGTQKHKVVLFNLATNEYAGTNTVIEYMFKVVCIIIR